MGSQISDIVQHCLAAKQITEADVKQLRGAIYGDGFVDDAEAAKLFVLNDGCRSDGTAWVDLFIGALTDYVVGQQQPEGYITAKSSEWLMSQILADGQIKSKTELELLVNVIDKARWAPVSLVEFALEQVKHAVINGDGPLRGGHSLEPGTITPGEVEMLRRILYAFGGDQNIAVTQREAQVLFEINDATAHQPMNPAWTEFFCKAIMNTLMAHCGYQAPTREEALRTEAWLETRGDLSLGAMFGTIMEKGLSGILEAYREQSAEERSLARLERQRIEIITSEEITSEEVDWLVDRLGRDEKLTANEKALVDFIKAESHKIHPSLMTFVEKLERAA